MDKKLIFTVTTGRSGTGTLYRIFNSLNCCYSVHEPHPHPFTFNSPKEFWDNRLKFIDSRAQNFYVETSHLLCKGYLDEVIERGLEPGLIVLRRPHREVAKSLCLLNSIPGKNDKAGQYFLMEPQRSTFLPSPGNIGFKKYNDYQKCYWYCLEIEKRQEHYANLVENDYGDVFYLNFDSFSEIDLAEWLFKYYRMPFTERELDKAKRMTSSIYNDKSHIKARRKVKFNFTDTELDELEKEVRNSSVEMLK